MVAQKPTLRRPRRVPLVALLVLAASLKTLEPPAAAQFPFTDRSVLSGLDLAGTKEGGLAWGDWNADGCLDLIVHTADTAVQSRLFLQYAPGGVCNSTFDDVTDCVATGMNDKPDPPILGTARYTERTAVWGDIDNDGDLDTQLNTSGAGPDDQFSADLYLNNGPGVTAGAACGYDPDNNAVIDPVPWAVFRFGGNVAISVGGLNVAPGGLQTVTIDGINTEHASFNDYDKDGDLDWFLDNHGRGVIVLRNSNNWTGGAPLPFALDAGNGMPFCLAPADCTPIDGDYGASADLDRDGDVDHIARKPAGFADLFINDGTGPVYFPVGVEIDASANGEAFKGGVTPCDFDSDGDLDFFWTDNGTNRIWQQTGTPLTPAADGSGAFVATGEPAASTGFAIVGENLDDAVCGDYDNDGDLDLLLTGDLGDYLLRNDFVENGGSLSLPADRLEFTCVMGPNGACINDSTACAAGSHLGCGDSEAADWGDINRDGDLDLVINHNPNNEYWRNNTNNTDYVMVRALWDVDGLAGGITRDAVGATVQLYDCGGRLLAPLLDVSAGRGQGSQDPPIVHFGLEFGSGYPYIVRVEFVGGAVVERAVVPASLAPGYQQVNVRSTDASDTTVCLTPALFGPLSGRARADGGPGVELQFETAAELGTAGFWLFRSDERGEVEPVSAGLVLAQPPAPQGGRYRLFDHGATPPYERYRYHFVELEQDGRRLFHRPVAAAFTAPAGAPAPDRGEPALRLTRQSARRRAAAPPRAPPESASAPPVALKLAVDQRGLYHVTAGEIATGLGLSADQARALLLGDGLALVSRGAPVAWRRSADGESLLFLGDAADSRYTKNNVYWLRPGAGLPMASSTPGLAAERIFSDGFESGDLGAWLAEEGGGGGTGGGGNTGASVVSAVATFEENLFAATAFATDPDADFWYWHAVSAGHPTLGSANLTLSPEAPAPATAAMITVELQGASPAGGGQSYRIEATLNGTSLGELAWQGNTRFAAQFAAPQGTLTPGPNTLVLTGRLPDGVALSIFYVDRLTIHYQRRLEAIGDRLEFTADTTLPLRLLGFSDPELVVLSVDDPLRPVWIPVTAEAGAGGWRLDLEPELGARYLAVAAPALGAALATPRPQTASPLAIAAGADYLVITHASLRAEAERLVARRAGEGLAAAALDVEDVYDELSYGLVDPAAIRTLLTATEPQDGERFVVLAGKGHFDYRDSLRGHDNLVPPLLQATPSGLIASDLLYLGEEPAAHTSIGRVPAHDPAGLAAYVDRLIAFEDGSGAWKHSVLLASDDQDEQGDFAYSSGVLRSVLPSAYQAFDVSLAQSSLADARTALFAGLDTGAAVLNYFGHGGADRLAAEGLLTSADVAALTNQGRAPIVLGLTCNVGRFDLPNFDTLGEQLVVGAPGGAAAVWSSSALSSNPEALRLGIEAVDALLGGAHTRLGSALRAAGERFGAAGDRFELLRLYTLLGDPALRLP